MKRQQRILMTKLGISREGERIGDEALDACLKLFAEPLQQHHIDTILSLFGWDGGVAPLMAEELGGL